MSWFENGLRDLNDERKQKLHARDIRRWLFDADRDINNDRENEKSLCSRFRVSAAVQQNVLSIRMADVGNIGAYYIRVDDGVRFIPADANSPAARDGNVDLDNEDEFRKHIIDTVWALAGHKGLLGN